MLRGRTRTPRWRRRQRTRRALVAALLVVAAAAVASELSGSEEGRPVVLAAHDLPAGTRLEADDLAATVVPPTSPLLRVALDEQEVLGRTLATSVAAGEMLTATRLFGDDAAAAATPGTTTMPVVFAEPAIAAFLQPGMVVDLLWTPGGLDERGAQVVASGARVLGTPGPDDGAGGGVFSAAGTAAPVLLEVRTADAAATAAALGTGSLTVALHRGPGSGLSTTGLGAADPGALEPGPGDGSTPTGDPDPAGADQGFGQEPGEGVQLP